MDQMDKLDFRTDAELLRFFRCKKTEMSCMEHPHTFLNQLRDHDLAPEELYKKVKRTRTKEQKESAVYEVLDWIEQKQSQKIKEFWKCVFRDHILQHYPALRILRDTLLDESLRFYQHLPCTEGQTKGEVNQRDSQKRGAAERENERRGKRRKTERRVSEDEEEDEESSSQKTPTQRKHSSKPTFSSPVKGQVLEIWTYPLYKHQLPVQCGDKDGTLYRRKLANGGVCILSKRRWFTPAQFEDFGGKGRNKNWKLSIRCHNTPLQKLIQEGHLMIAPKRRRKPLQERKSKRILFQSSSSDSTSSCISLESSEESEEVNSEEEESEEREQAEERSLVGDVDVSEFQSLTLSITCGSATATLHKQRFASGAYGKCIRTEERWWTPMEFVEQNSTLDNSHWKRDIYCCGKPLSFLLQMKILQAHSVLCDCKLCSRLEEDVQEQNNDDECFICDGVGDLICCDECPRSFHHKCHLPTVDPDLLGEQWICTFCLLRKWQSWRYSSHMTLEEVLNSPVSQYKLQCQYLLLCLYKEDVKRVFGPNPCTTVPGYSNVINKVMYLEKVTEKLQEGQYETLDQLNSDIQLIFQNCATFNKDNEFGRMGARLKDMYEKEFQSIFNIQ
ncbi:nuclear body protein SP140-like protein [Chanos chanos]|uniref:Nuclear body protein SP140-like protein n=1 Tax=Chanos chanos TaxID=29144 RepID=A0A6J2WY12_CHACN|nr:nuclear body protein SP140-like protein [Chanos chanos]